MITIGILKGASMRESNERWQKSNSTIHRILYQVIHAFMNLESKFYFPPRHDSEVPSYIESNPKFYPFFKDCIGAFDGSHCSVFNKDGV